MGKQTSNMKNALLLLSIVGLALVCADLHTEDQYTEDANVIAVDDSTDEMDDSTDEMDDSTDEMEDSRRGNNNCHAGFTYYEAKFDDDERLNRGIVNGYFRMKICNDGSFARYNTAFTLSPYYMKARTQFTYHLDSMGRSLHPNWNHSRVLHPRLLLPLLQGHYDSTFKCGDKSSFRDAVPNFCVPKFPRAAADDYGPSCSTDKTKCELGDISGKMGKLDIVDLTTRYYDVTSVWGLYKSNEVPSCAGLCTHEDYDSSCAGLCHTIHSGGRVQGWTTTQGDSGWSPKDKNPPRIEDYDEWGGNSGATFSSIVVRACNSEGTCESSLVGARLVQYKPWGPNIPHWRAQRVWKECPHSTLYKAQRRKGDGINTGDNGKKFKGHFEMRICNDGSSAKYSGELWDIASEQTSLKYHVHTGSFENLSETGGHYDPTYKCGSASANQNPTSNKCGLRAGSRHEYNVGTPYPELGFELGDLSGRNGLIVCNEYKGSSRCTVDVTDTNPPRNVDFVGNGKAGNKQSNQFASIVFHRGVDGPECAKCKQAPTTAPTPPPTPPLPCKATPTIPCTQAPTTAPTPTPALSGNSGSCYVDPTDLCVTSSNFPSPDGSSIFHLSGTATGCSITVNTDGLLTATTFDTDKFHDKLVVDGTMYTGSTGPVNQAVSSGAAVAWLSETSGPPLSWHNQEALQGWKLCHTPHTYTTCKNAAKDCAGTKLFGFRLKQMN